MSEIVSLLNKAIESAKENPMLTYFTPSPVFKANEKLVKDPTKNKDKSEFFVIEDEDALLRYADDDYDDYFNENIVFEKFLGLSIEASKYVKNISKLWRDAAN